MNNVSYELRSVGSDVYLVVTTNIGNETITNEINITDQFNKIEEERSRPYLESFRDK